MLDRTSLATSLKTLALDHFGSRADGVDFYLFGSALNSPAPSDIDLLVVYERSRIEPTEAVAFRKQMKERIDERLDVCLLSDLECQSNPFIADEGCALL
jgi:predicted nucleotidyltransferase